MPAPHSRTQIACVRMEPYSLWLLESRHPGVPVAVLDEQSRKVTAMNAEAELQGVSLKMPLAAATSRCPDLHAEVISNPTMQAEWARLLEFLYRGYSPKVHGPRPGTAYLTVTPQAARDLAAALHAPVGLAASQEVALLAVLRAKPGEVREISEASEAVYLPLTPLNHLGALGLTAKTLERLTFLGLRGLADLMKWSKAQRASFLGAENGPIADLLAGKRTTKVLAYQPTEVIEKTLAFNAPLEEPGEAEAALADLLAGVESLFRRRICTYLTLHADTVGGRLSATRKLKWPLDDKGLRHVALLTLNDSGALPLGVDSLTVSFSGFAQPSRQIGLWPDAKELDAVKNVLERFPAALVKIGWRDAYATAFDVRYTWLDFLTGEERPHANTPIPPETSPQPIRLRADLAARAFFEARQ